MLRHLLAAFLYGRALGRFYRGDVEQAARGFATVLRVDPLAERMDLCEGYLGRCYVELGRDREAVEVLRRACRGAKRHWETTEPFQRGEILAMLRSLSHALARIGELEEAEVVAREEAELSGTR